MLRLVVNERKPVGREETTIPDRPSPAREGVQARMDLCEVELGAVIACSIIESFVRNGAIRPEQGEHTLERLAIAFNEIAEQAPTAIRDAVSFKEFAARLQAAAAMVRGVMVELSLGHDNPAS